MLADSIYIERPIHCLGWDEQKDIYMNDTLRSAVSVGMAVGFIISPYIKMLL